MLEIENLKFDYGKAQILRGLNIRVEKNEIVTIIGPNGAGKTTLLNLIARSLRPRSGHISLDGKLISSASQSAVVRAGCVLVPEGRQVFSSMSVHENLRLGAYARGRESMTQTMEQVFDLFPRLKEREKQAAGTMSGGEQQMLAIGRAMMSTPQVMLLDEPSLGLAPQIVSRIMRALNTLRESGMTIVLVEQNAMAALGLADRGYLISGGLVRAEGTSEELKDNEAVKHVYLGSAPEAAA